MADKLAFNPIAVTGLACWYPDARSPKELWENILARRIQFRRYLDQRLPIADYHNPDRTAPDKTYGSRAAYIDGYSFDWVLHHIPLSTVKAMDVAHWLALNVALRAIEDAGYKKETLPHETTGVILGNTLTGEQSRSNAMRLRWPFVKRTFTAALKSQGVAPGKINTLLESGERYFKSVFQPVNEDTLAGGLSNTIAGRICNYLNLNGGGYTIDGACSSSLLAVANAAAGLNSGELDLVLAGGVDISLDPFEIVGFAKTSALTMNEMNVYDRRGSGFIPGEGCGFTVLKRLDDAVRDGDYIYAVIHGCGISSDGGGTGLTAPSAKGQAHAIRRAYEKAPYDIDTLAFIEGHGTGTVAGDSAELAAISLVMGKAVPAVGRSCGVTSLKSIIGHTKAASGIGAFIKAVMAVNRRVLPPTASCKEPHQIFEDKALHLFPIIQGEIYPPDTIMRAGVSSMGFGGINCHITIESGSEPSPKLAPDINEQAMMAAYQETEIFVFANDDPRALQKRLDDLLTYSHTLSQAELTDLSYKLAQEIDSSARLRAALVAGSPDELTNRLKELLAMVETYRSSENVTRVNALRTVWFGRQIESPRIGMLFPGQGSQKMNMARILVQRFSWAANMLKQADQCLITEGFNPVSPIIFHILERADSPGVAELWLRDLSRTENLQPAICTVSAIWFEFLKRLNIKPVVVGGHSLGELTAFYAAGTFDFLQLVHLAAVRGSAMAAADGEAGTMASLRCTRETAKALLGQASDYVILANINGPEQMVISGTKSGVEQVIRLAEEKQIQAYRLRVSNAFHSKLSQKASAVLADTDILPDVPAALNVRLFSGLNGMEISPSQQLKAHFSNQAVSQVDFVSMIGAMSKICDIFIEVGPGRALSGLVSAINGEKGPSAMPVESLPGQDKDLNQLLAALFIQGIDIAWENLFAKRLIKPFIPPAERTFIDNPCERPFTLDEAAAVDFSGSSPGIIEQAILSSTDFSEETLKTYLAARGAFLSEVVRADIKHMYSNTLPTDSAAPSYSAPEREIKQPLLSTGEVIKSALFSMIKEMTGFPLESLSPDMRLLDDLNLDSIKSSTLIIRLRQKSGIKSEQLDPRTLANAKLSEIVERFEGLAVKTPSLMSSAATPVTTLLLHRETWVRDFTVSYSEAKLSEDHEDPVKWHMANVLILADQESTELVSAISAALLRLGAQLKAASYEEAQSEKLVQDLKFSHFMAILPRKPLRVSTPEEALQQTITRLTALSNLPSSKLRPATLVYVQFGEGCFGRTGYSSHYTTCCASALAKSIHLERPDLKVRVLDFCSDADTVKVAHRIICELQMPESFAEAGYDAYFTRRVSVHTPTEPAAYRTRDIDWTPADIILVTGGARGITASCAFDLAKKTGVRMALVGRTPQPMGEEGNEEVRKWLKRYEEAGLTARYYACDVVQAEAVTALIAQIEAEMGNVSGLVHGAGLNVPRMCQDTTIEQAVYETAPKILGAIHLLDALKGKKLKLGPLAKLQVISRQSFHIDAHLLKISLLLS